MWRYNREPVDYDTFDENKNDYTGSELEAYASALLRADAKTEKHWHKKHGILFQEHYESRKRREVFTGTGDTPDAVITASLSKDGQTMYNRTHPQGRKVNSEKQRRDNGASFYRN